jgi:hypothetical protein
MSDFMFRQILVFFTLLFGTIIYLVLIGRINLKGLLRDKRDGEISPGRIQLLVVTLMTAGMYIMRLLSSEDAGVLPALPQDQNLLVLLGGSHIVYLSGKLFSTLRNRGKLKQI